MAKEKSNSLLREINYFYDVASKESHNYETPKSYFCTDTQKI
jgi:hypothetical protein